MQIKLAKVAQGDSNPENVVLIFTWLLADRKLVIKVLKTVEIALKIVASKHKSEPADNSNVEVLITEAGPELDPALLLNHSHRVLLVVEPGHAHLEPIVDVVVRVGKVIRQCFHCPSIQVAHFTRAVVELQDAQVSEKLAFLNIFESDASDGGIQIEVLKGSTVVRVWGDRPDAIG